MESKINQIEACGDNPFASLIRHNKERNQRVVDDIRDPSRLMQRKIPFSTPADFDKYPNSPTASKYKDAFYYFWRGYTCLTEYEKESVESEDDCGKLEEGFRCYAMGFILENLLVSFFLPPTATMTLLDQYLQFRPSDAYAGYFQVRLYMRDQDTQEKLMRNIVKIEILANKFASWKMTNDLKMILSDVYCLVAALYTVSSQRDRALDSFEKAVNVDSKNTNAIYGIAFNSTVSDPRRAEHLLKTFLELAPPCDKQYLNVLYQLSYFYFMQKNFSRCARYFELAQSSEETRLPFLPKVEIDAKFMMLETMKLKKFLKSYCNNPDCQTEPSAEELKRCTRCRKVNYCSRECQRQDWAYHRKFCRK